MKADRCPHCRAVLPLPKTCAGCGGMFYRGEGGRADAAHCSRKCAGRARVRRWRQRERTAAQ